MNSPLAAGFTMPITFTLLLVLGTVGIIDVGWYHLFWLRLYRDPRALHEQLAHLSRGVLYVAMLCLVIPFTPRGHWVDVGFAVFAADALNTLVDTLLERYSRPRGLPHGEYIVHVAGSVLVGAAAVAYGFEAWPMRAQATALVPRTTQGSVAWAPWLAVAIVALVVLLEAALHAHARWARGGFARYGRDIATDASPGEPAGASSYNNHHAVPGSARMGVKWYELDAGWLVVRALEALRVVRNVHAWHRPGFEGKATARSVAPHFIFRQDREARV